MKTNSSNVFIRDLEKLNLNDGLFIGPSHFFAADPAPSKNTIRFKMELKNYYFASFVIFQFKISDIHY
jgi:hypothetical protein